VLQLDVEQRKNPFRDLMIFLASALDDLKKAKKLKQQKYTEEVQRFLTLIDQTAHSLHLTPQQIALLRKRRNDFEKII
jgi:hypothetical protein